MKKLFVVLALFSSLAFAEASFDQIQSLIQQGQYQAAEQGLEVIIKNHPQSAKAFYAMAQAQAGLGNLDKANKALNIATGLNPTLDFAPASSVQSLRQAITPQTKKIEAIEETHYVRNTFLAIILIGCAYWIWVLYQAKRRDEEEGTAPTGGSTPPSKGPNGPTTSTFTNPTPATSYSSGATRAATAQAKVDVPKPQVSTPTTATVQQPAAPVIHHTYSQPAPTVINNTSSNDGLLTGVLIGSMMNNHHHDRVVEREVVREVEVPRTKRDSSWDDDSSSSSIFSSPSSSSRSSSWDDDSSSSKRSSSWDDSSSSSSSWSSSSDSSSSSSWDSGSSSSSDSSW